MIHEEFKEIRKKMYEESPRWFVPKANSIFAHKQCEQAATHHLVQRSHMPKIAGREMEREEEVARRETLSDFLKECEFQTHKFRDHLSFSEFFKMKVNERKQ